MEVFTLNELKIYLEKVLNDNNYINNIVVNIDKYTMYFNFYIDDNLYIMNKLCDNSIENIIEELKSNIFLIFDFNFNIINNVKYNNNKNVIIINGVNKRKDNLYILCRI